MSNLSRYAKYLLSLALLAAEHSAWAGCSSSTTIVNKTFSSTGAASFSVARDVAPGTPIGPRYGSYAGTGTQVTCTNGTAYTLLKFASTMTPTSFADVYETNVPGIGVKVWSDFQNTVYVGNNAKMWYSPGGSSTSGYSGNAWITNIYFQFYVIGPVTPGQVALPLPTVQAWLNTSTTSTAGGANYNALSMTDKVTATVKACTTPSFTVNLGKHKATEFAGVGSVSSSTPFNFQLNSCLAGMDSVSYTFQPVTSLIGTPAQHITLDGSSTASGVGIQMLYDNDTPVPFNTRTRFTGYTGAAGSFSIPMRARYIKVAERVQPGTANSSVVFTMTYQ